MVEAQLDTVYYAGSPGREVTNWHTDAIRKQGDDILTF